MPVEIRSIHGSVIQIFSRDTLCGARLAGVLLDEADLAGADLTRSTLLGCELYGARLTNAILTDANLEEATLTNADLSGADLSGANLEGANLSGANLEGANLSRARLAGACLIGANLTNANLTDAWLSEANFMNATWEGAIGIATRAESTALLDQIREIVLADSERLSMCRWHGFKWNPYSIPEVPGDCGTTHCLAGWAQALSHDMRIRLIGADQAGGLLIPTATHLFLAANKGALEFLRTREYAKEGI